jgi:[protein-PII] uridylyltransferase
MPIKNPREIVETDALVSRGREVLAELKKGEAGDKSRTSLSSAAQKGADAGSPAAKRREIPRQARGVESVGKGAKSTAKSRKPVTGAIERAGEGDHLRAALLPVLAEALQAGEAEIRARFEASPLSTAPIRERAYLIDQLLRAMVQLGREAVAPQAEGLAVVAVGGYGRRELFFFSDVDIMFLYDPAHKAEAEKLARFMLYLLWDLGLKVGQSVRSVEEALREAREDYTTRTNVLEARFVCGEKKLAAEFEQRFRSEIATGTEQQFVEAKLKEWKERHERCGDSRYVLEPNIKEGKGGLRDLQTLIWMVNYCYGVQKMGEIAALGKITESELQDFRNARQFLRLVRLHLHAFAGRAEERLNFDAQRHIAAKLGYTQHSGTAAVERFMKRYFLTAKTVGQLTRTLCHLLDEEHKRRPRRSLITLLRQPKLPEGFVVQNDWLHFSTSDIAEKQPEKMIEIFWVMHDTGIDIHPSAWQQVTRNIRRIDAKLRENKHANETFLKLLLDMRNPEYALRKMNESGVFGRFVPDFGRVVGQMQFDLYHTYTVDEHTIFALGILHRIERGEFAEGSPLATKIIKHIHMRRVLYLGLLCHDIAKGRGGDHSSLGADVARDLGRRFGFDSTECETAAWLVQNHLLMTMTAFKRDLDDPRTIRDFVQVVQTPEKLRLLLVLTVADIRAVGPTIWNGWKGSLLRALYYRAAKMMGQEEGESESSLTELAAYLAQKLPKTDAALHEEYISQAEPAFLDSQTLEEHARLLPLWQEVKGGRHSLVTDFRSDDFESITHVDVIAPDQPGLFAKIAGVLAMSGANILNARIYTRKDGIIIDRFGIQDAQGKPYDEKRRQDRLKDKLADALQGTLDVEQELREAQRRYPRISESFALEPKIFIDNHASENCTLIEVQCLDQLGLLYRIASTLTEQGLNIATAHVTTFGELAVDVFYVKDSYGMKLHHDKRQQQVIAALYEAVRTPIPQRKAG